LNTCIGSFFQDRTCRRRSGSEKEGNDEHVFYYRSYYIKGENQKAASKVALAAFRQYLQVFFSFKNIHKFLYCNFGLSKCTKAYVNLKVMIAVRRK
jgi:hypothetical protein